MLLHTEKLIGSLSLLPITLYTQGFVLQRSAYITPSSTISNKYILNINYDVLKKLGKEYILRFYITLKFHLSILLKLFINFYLGNFVHLLLCLFSIKWPNKREIHMPKSISTFSLNFVLSQTFQKFKNIKEKFHFTTFFLLLIPQCFQIISETEQEMLKYCQPGFLIEFPI